MVEPRCPLEGVKVVEVCMFQQAPVCFAMMADMGADVIKVEPPVTGELGRRLGPMGKYGLRGYFENNNRGKRSLAIDYTKPEGLSVLYRLAKDCDIFAQNYRPGVARRRGFAYEDIKKINPSVVYLSMSAYGPEGPNADAPGVDGQAQAMGGIASVNGGSSGPMLTLGVAIADQTAAFINCIATLMALYHKRMTGEGQKIETSLLGGQIALMGHSLTQYLFSNDVLPRRGGEPGITGGDAPGISGCYEAQDGWSFLISILATHYDRFFDVMELDYLRKNPKFATPDEIARNGIEFLNILKAKFRTKPRDDWIKICRDNDLIAAPVNNFREVAQDPDVLANKYITGVDHPVG